MVKRGPLRSTDKRALVTANGAPIAVSEDAIVLSLTQLFHQLRREHE